MHIKCSHLALVLFHVLEAVALVDDCRVELLVPEGRVLLAILGRKALMLGCMGTAGMAMPSEPY